MNDDEFYIKAYTEYRHEINRVTFSAKPIPYDWFNLPRQIGMEWWPYCEYLKDVSRQLANDINQFRRDIIKLESWKNVIKSYNDEEKFYLIIEFIEPLAIVALSLPYAIRSRFIFSLSHICHQANRVKDPNWRDDLSDDRSIKFNTMEIKCSCWNAYSNFRYQFVKIAVNNLIE